MKKQIIIYTLLFLIPFVLCAQGSPNFLKNKVSLEYDVNFRPYGTGGIAELIGDLTVMEVIKSTKKFHIFTANYKIKSRMSVALFGGFHGNDLATRYASSTGPDSYKVSGTEVGLGLNFYYRSQRAPLGNSFGVFLKSNSIKAKDEIAQTNFSSSVYELSSISIGASFNYINMISSKLPIYLKYSFSGSFPIIFKETLPTLNTNFIYYEETELNFRAATDDYQFLHVFKIHVGIGYAF